MNIFEGSRRVALIFAGLILIGSFIAIVIDKPFVELNYAVTDVGRTLIKSGDNCRIGLDASQSRNHNTPDGKSFYIKFCFLSIAHEGTSRGIAYKSDTKYTYFNGPYSSEVIEFTASIADAYIPTPQDYSDAAEEYSRARWANIERGAGYLGLALFVYWLTVAAIGWIVRGFMGIPRGRDSK
ncbi:hypothetical protein [Pseudoduganella lurida]|uniref:hypothetical protein n=1 Tax=Pseudoduganella lurida TaxID=1036180 RepID=UPI0011A75041|nr:hypothetical protein [Pseudoduganella lurida]